MNDISGSFELTCSALKTILCEFNPFLQTFARAFRGSLRNADYRIRKKKVVILGAYLKSFSCFLQLKFAKKNVIELACCHLFYYSKLYTVCRLGIIRILSPHPHSLIGVLFPIRIFSYVFSHPPSVSAFYPYPKISTKMVTFPVRNINMYKIPYFLQYFPYFITFANQTLLF